MTTLDEVCRRGRANTHQKLHDLRARDELLDKYLHGETDLQGRQCVVGVHNCVNTTVKHGENQAACAVLGHTN